MTGQRALRERLLADATVAALVEARVYPAGELPQAPTLPAITYQLISDVDGVTQDGATGLRRPRVQLDQYALTYLQLDDLSEAVRDALHGKAWVASDGTVVMLTTRDSEQDLPIDPDVNLAPSVKLRRRRADYFVHFKQAA